MNEEVAQVEAEINNIIAENNFPLEVLNDVFHRLNCCSDLPYVKQQLRYLQNYKRQILDKNNENTSKEDK
ncbi:hypothetical protein P0G38_06810 [Enterococcus casseliflavus]|uniref:DUF6877 family protein n=1 Tax=Enterococcus casseliflavus TaxID=37734 RepID=UPI0023DAE75F|nr:DUF6877 family protein [Enterococcus casseliflavus]WEL48764.1 hypothetical protein P0G38_06810 [Enterococcus casseliflavus]